VVRREEGRQAVPVVCNVDFGHTDPMWTIPLGVPVRVEPREKRITFLESGVS
jgi:muramoyltetrapeptide carboxypeptidase LdcA involved in peptidoglycan recycling